jgi:hypothetical protein
MASQYVGIAAVLGLEAYPVDAEEVSVHVAYGNAR